jgi:hypothetical protein
MMRNGLIPIAIGVFSCQLALAKDFKKSYQIPPGAQITIVNFLGNIKVTGHKGKDIELVAYMKSPEGDSVVIDEERFGDAIRIFSRDSLFAPPKEFPSPKPFAPPKQFGPPREFGPLRGFGPPRGSAPPKEPGPPAPAIAPNAKVDFEIRIPQTIEYKIIRINTLNGNVEVSNVKGRFWITSQRGSVELKDVKGSTTASSTSGNVSVYLEKTRDRNAMDFSSISGNVEVHAPSNLDASVDMRCLSGLLKTDFSIEVQEYRYGMGKFALGKVGEGLQSLNIRSNSGRCSLLHK